MAHEVNFHPKAKTAVEQTAAAALSPAAAAAAAAGAEFEPGTDGSAGRPCSFELSWVRHAPPGDAESGQQAYGSMSESDELPAARMDNLCLTCWFSAGNERMTLFQVFLAGIFRFISKTLNRSFPAYRASSEALFISASFDLACHKLPESFPRRLFASLKDSGPCLVPEVQRMLFMILGHLLWLQVDGRTPEACRDLCRFAWLLCILEPSPMNLCRHALSVDVHTTCRTSLMCMYVSVCMSCLHVMRFHVTHGVV